MVRLIRYYSGEDCTLGVMLGAGWMLHTLENPWLDNQVNISCIPCGEYNVRPFSGARYHDVWILENVKDRSYILIHYGNTAKDTEGCVLVGLSVGELAVDGERKRAVLSSRDAMKALTDYIGTGNSFTLKIEDVC